MKAEGIKVQVEISKLPILQRIVWAIQPADQVEPAELELAAKQLRTSPGLGRRAAAAEILERIAKIKRDPDIDVLELQEAGGAELELPESFGPGQGGR